MKIFSGFPSGKVQVTPLPNVFFSELLPAIDDLAELKVTLHILWLIANEKSRQLYVSARALVADRALAQSLAAERAAPGDALARALERAVNRGTLLRLDQGTEQLYFLNSESGRRAYERAEGAADKLPRAKAREPANAAPRANVFALYEQNIGMLTPMIAEELKEADAQYAAEWIADAFKIAVENNKRSWSYIRAILQRWKDEGRGEKGKKGKPLYDEYRKFVNR